MDDEKLLLKKAKALEASRRWRAAHPDRAREVGRAAYHRHQEKLGKASAPRVKMSAEEAARARAASDRAKSKRWRDANPEKVAEALKRRKTCYAENPEYFRQKSMEWYRRNRDKALERLRWAHKKRLYGLTREQYEAMPKECAICGAAAGFGKNKRLHVDHCHDTKIVRGMLCGGCNVGIGYLRHDPGLLRKAADYCEKWQVR